jgi:hypothetical protein
MHVIQKRRQKLLESSTELRSGLNSDDALEPLSSPPHMDLLSRFMGVTTEAEELRTLDSSGGDDQKRGGYSDVFLRDIVISFLLAGRDTTSSGKKTFREAEGVKKPILKKTVRNLILHLFLFSSCRNLLVTKKSFAKMFQFGVGGFFHRSFVVVLVVVSPPSRRRRDSC